ncbi:elastin-like [Cylas formicarius]|uniref:elastin-like n=1 Tax=Cylas formicarius TaxID=197179 RepID=UPI00295843F3|nr:elastin-like [Cylas formicarius]
MLSLVREFNEKRNKMKSLSLAVFLVVVAAASAGLHAGVVSGYGARAVIAGPAGTVVRGGVAHGVVAPGLVAPGIVAPGIVTPGIVAPGVIAGGVIAGRGILGAPGLLAGHGLLAPGSGLEGQWIPDINEKLYDDGSYKPYLYH